MGVSHSVPYQHHHLTTLSSNRGKQFVRMGGLADKLLCNVILFNLRMATNIIAAMNLVASTIGSIVSCSLLVWHAVSLGHLGEGAKETVQDATEKAAGSEQAFLSPLSVIVTSILLGVCVGYIV